jgi:pyruvate-ferredoxin/flavodoxin oxidoreductase
VNGCEQQKLAVDCGHWPLYRFDPRRVAEGKPPLQLDSPEPKADLASYVRNETRYRMVEASNPAHFKELMALAQAEIANRYAVYKGMSEMVWPVKSAGDV